MDKNGKLFGKISIVDLLVVLVVLVVAAGTVYRFASPATNFDDDGVTVDFVIRIEGVRTFTLPYYQGGLRVYDRQMGQFIGVIHDFHTATHYRSQVLHDGSVIFAPLPDNFTNVYLTIRASGRETDGAIFVEGTYEVAVNSVRNIRTRYISVQGIIHSITVN